uniref:Inositol polyphosphate-related phosphatase domain-containing protein n=1 Tax=Stomoxys calcitrans TaxID=35570 RepID=A0A1I8QBZ0_STOCA
MTSLGGSGSIPTISASVSSSSLSTTNNALNSSTKQQQQTTKQIVQQKFKENENVLSIFEAYQIVGSDHTSRILCLVVSLSGGTYAVFSMTASHLPPRTCSDLTIEKAFPLNDSFYIGNEKKGSISQLQFTIKCSDEQAVKYFYFPLVSDEEGVDFDTFQAQVLSAKMSMVHTPALQNETNSLSFAWVNDYRQIGEVKQEMKRRENEYIKYKDFTIYCATYNVNNKSYCDSPLHLWLAASEAPPDIYAIALQELDTSAKAVTFSENRPDYLWINKMLASVHDKGEYEELTSVRLVGMMLTVIVKRQIRSSITRHSVKSIARGILNTLGNKGGVAVSLQLNEANLCFVNSHLAAHMGFVEARNEDFHGIVKGLVFDDDLRRTINDHENPPRILVFKSNLFFLFPAGTPHAAAEALLMLLNLPEKPLLDPYVEELLKTNTTAEAMELVSLLSSPKRNVFVHLCMFLREGIERKYYNAMHVATIFGRVLLRSTKKTDDYYRDTHCREFMLRFINAGEMVTLSSSAAAAAGSHHHHQHHHHASAQQPVAKMTASASNASLSGGNVV